MNKFWSITKAGAINAVRILIFVISLIGAVVIVIGPALALGLANLISNEHANDEDTSAVIDELKKIGFKTAKEVSLKDGGNL